MSTVLSSRFVSLYLFFICVWPFKNYGATNFPSNSEVTRQKNSKLKLQQEPRFDLPVICSEKGPPEFEISTLRFVLCVFSFFIRSRQRQAVTQLLTRDVERKHKMHRPFLRAASVYATFVGLFFKTLSFFFQTAVFLKPPNHNYVLYPRGRDIARYIFLRNAIRIIRSNLFVRMLSVRGTHVTGYRYPAAMKPPVPGLYSSFNCAFISFFLFFFGLFAYRLFVLLA